MFVLFSAIQQSGWVFDLTHSHLGPSRDQTDMQIFPL